MPGEGYQQRTAKIRQPGRQKGENSQKKMVRTQQLAQDSQNKTYQDGTARMG
jgi:hypothetical protein